MQNLRARNGCPARARQDTGKPWTPVGRLAALGPGLNACAPRAASGSDRSRIAGSLAVAQAGPPAEGTGRAPLSTCTGRAASYSRAAAPPPEPAGPRAAARAPPRHRSGRQQRSLVPPGEVALQQLLAQ